MKGLLVGIFLLLALTAGVLIGWAAIAFLQRRGRSPRKALVILGLGVFFGLGSSAVYYAASRRVDRDSTRYPGSPGVVQVTPAWEKFQFEMGRIQIARAEADEPIRKDLSSQDALSYLEQGVEVWDQKYRCIACHVNGSYLLLRPALSRVAGPPSRETRRFFVSSLEAFVGKREEILLLVGNGSAQVVWAAAGLASWDAHVGGALSPETDAVLRSMFRLQRENGAWLSPDCWPPLQSDPFQLATVAALGAATAPGWLERLDDRDVRRRVDLLKTYLRDTVPPHDYARVWLLWASTALPGLLAPPSRTASVELLWRLQHQDGGWALRDFAAPEEWGGGSRRDRLKAEAGYATSPSDGHMTGLAVCVLRDAGIPSTDPRIQKAANWLLSNQRKSGRWYARSLNTDTYHYLTYSATCFALAALSKCGRLPASGRQMAETGWK
jgi:hypothetical protein